MFRNGKFKKTLIITLLFILTLSTVAIAANNIYVKKLTATHGRIKFKVDGKDITKQIESKYGSPAFVVKEYDSRSYVPVRAIAELMGMEVKWDGKTHTAEIIDTKSEQYEKELKKKDNEIAELKKEIEKLKKNVVDETDLKAIEKKLNNEYGTYEGVDFDITLKESKSRIDVDIVMDLRDGRQEAAWLRMRHNDRKYMVEDIVDIIASKFSNVDIYGSIYDEFDRRDVMSFNKRKNSSISISYDDRRYGYAEDDIDEIVYREFFDYDRIDSAYVYNLNDSGSSIYLDIHFSDPSDRRYWENLDKRYKKGILERIADEVDRYYYDYYYYDRYDYYGVDIKVEGDSDSYYYDFRY